MAPRSDLGNDSEMQTVEVPALLTFGYHAVDLAINSEEAAPVRLQLNWKVDLDFKRDLYLLAVGVKTYEASSLNLDYADRDAQEFSEFMAAQVGPDKLFGRVARKKILVNESAKQSDIIDELDALADRANRNPNPSIVVIMFSGHGRLDQTGATSFCRTTSIRPSTTWMRPTASRGRRCRHASKACAGRSSRSWIPVIAAPRGRAAAPGSRGSECSPRCLDGIGYGGVERRRHAGGMRGAGAGVGERQLAPRPIDARDLGSPQGQSPGAAAGTDAAAAGTQRRRADHARRLVPLCRGPRARTRRRSCRRRRRFEPCMLSSLVPITSIRNIRP